MRLNLDTLRTEIEDYLKSRGIVVFHSLPRLGEPPPTVYWNVQRDSDYHSFLAAAEAAGVRVVTLYSRELEEDVIEDALEQLADADLDRDERRSMEMRIKEMRGYSGFTCEIELAFDLATRLYIFNLSTEWFDELKDLIDRIEEAYDEEDDGDDDSVSGEYFSKN